MPREIDEKVVELTFDNKEFENGVHTSINTIEQLKNSLNFSGMSKSIDEINTAARGVNLDGIGSGIDAIKVKFSALQVMGTTALMNLTNSAINFGKKLTSSILSPIKTGGMKRALNIEQARFRLKGLGLDVEAIMKDANNAVTETAYGLDEAAKVASMFGASGLKAGKEMESSLKAVAGVAAMTGRSFEDIGNIFTTVAGNGKLMTMQLRQFSYSGLNASAVLAKYLNKTEAEINDMVTKGKIDFKTFATAMDEAFGSHAKDANKTFTGAMSNMKAALSRIGADFAMPYMEKMRDVMNSLSPLFDEVRKGLKPLVDMTTAIMSAASQKAVSFFGGIQAYFKEFNELGGSAHLVNALSNALIFFIRILRSVKEAFEEVFTPITAETLAKIAEKIEEFSKNLLISEETTNTLKEIFKILFSILKPLIHIFGELGTSVLPIAEKLIHILGLMASPISELLSSISDFLESSGILEKTLGAITNFFDYILDALTKISNKAKSFGSFTESIKNLFSKKTVNSGGGGGSAISTFVDTVNDVSSSTLNKTGDQINNVSNAISTLGNSANSAIPSVSKIISYLKDLGGIIAEKFKGFIKNLTLAQVLFIKTVTSIIFLIGTISKLNKELTNMSKKFGGIADSISELIKSGFGIRDVTGGFTKITDSISETILSYKKNNVPNIMSTVAKSIALLAASLFLLSKADSNSLFEAVGALIALSSVLVGISAGFEVFFAMMSKNENVDSVAVNKNINNLAKVLRSFALNAILLAASFRIIMGVKTEGVISKMLSFVAIIASMGAVTYALSTYAPELTDGTKFLIKLAASLLTIATAFNRIKPEETGKKIISFISIISSMTAAIWFLSKKSDDIKVGTVFLFTFAASVMLLAASFTKLGTEDVLNKGIVLAGLMVALGTAVGVLSNKAPKLSEGSATMLALSVSMIAITKSLNGLKDIPFTSLLKSIISMTSIVAAMVALANWANKVNSWNGILPMIGLIPSIMTALKKLADSKPEGLISAAVSISGIILAVGLSIKAIDQLKIAPSVQSAIGILTTTIITIAFSLGLVSKHEWNDILASGGAIVGVMAILIAFSYALSKIKTGGNIVAVTASIFIMSVSLYAIGKALSKLSGYHWKDIGAGLSAALLTLTIMAAILGVLGAVAGGTEGIGAAAILAVGAAFLMLGTSMALAGAGIYLGSKGLDYLLPVLEQIVYLDTKAISNCLIELSKGLYSLAGVGVLMLPAALGIAGFGLGLNVLSEALANIGKTEYESIFIGLNQFIEIINKLSNIGAELIKSSLGLNLFGVGLLVLSKSLLELSKLNLIKISLGIGLIFVNTRNSGQNASNLIKLSASMLVLSVALAALNATLPKSVLYLESFNNVISKTGNLITKNFKNSGINAGKALKNGVNSNKKDAVVAGALLGYFFHGGYKEAVEEHSPPAVFFNSACLAGTAIFNGSNAVSYLVEKGGRILGEKYVGGFVESLPGVTEAVETVKEAIVGENGGLTGLLEELGNPFEAATEAAEEFAGSLDDTTIAASDAFGTLSQTISDQMDIFSEFDKKTEMTMADVLSNMTSQLTGVAEWSDNLRILAERGIDEGLLEHLRNLGPEGYELVNAFVTGTDEQLQQAADLWHSYQLWPEDTATRIRNDAYNNGYDFGESTVDGTTDAIEDGEKEIAKSIDKTSSVIKTNLNNAGTDINTFLKNNAEKSGIDTSSFYNKGLTSGSPQIKQNANKISTDVINELDKSKEKAKGGGKNFTTAFANGLISTTGLATVKAATNTLCASFINTFFRNLKINSPSKIGIDAGGYIDEGFAIGLNKYANLVYDSGTTVGNTAVQSIYGAITKVNDILENGLDANPVIRPVLDTESIQNGINSMNGIFNDGYSTKMATNNANLIARNAEIVSQMENTKTNNTDIVNAINNLEERFGDLAESMGEMQMVMDTGAVIGQLAGPMDAELGQRAIRSRRGRG